MPKDRVCSWICVRAWNRENKVPTMDATAIGGSDSDARIRSKSPYNSRTAASAPPERPAYQKYDVAVHKSGIDGFGRGGVFGV